MQIDYLNSLPFGVFYKNRDFRYEQINKQMLHMVKFKQEAQVLGYTDREMPWEQYANIYNKYDKLLLANQKTTVTIDPVIDCSGSKWMNICKRSSAVNSEGKIMGILGLVTFLKNHTLLQSIFLLHENDKKLRSGMPEQGYEIVGNIGNLTKREFECLFFMLRGKSAKETAKILSIAPRTIEKHIEHIKLKLNCHRRSDIIEKALHDGLFQFIPQSFALFE